MKKWETLERGLELSKSYVSLRRNALFGIPTGLWEHCV